MVSPPLALPIIDASRRELAKSRLYVLCQTGGWLFFLVLQFGFIAVFAREKAHQTPGYYSALIQTVCIGWLLTHFARGYIRRWGWKNLGWKALVPRVAALSVVLSLIWCIAGYGLHHGVLGNPYPDKFNPFVLIAMSWINGSIMLVGWWCVYFFYQLFDRYNRLDIERLQLSSAVKEAELRALKAQINPHFIFNSLNSVRALIDEDPARARQAVTQLANLLRYSLQSGQLETVPLEEELRTVNDYLALEQVRHEERLRLRIDVAPDVLYHPLPPMLLQTLVENAVKYGISSRPEGGEVGITARCVSGRLELRVTNPGTLAGGASTGRREGSTGLGLQNAANRLRLLFGEQATCELREEPAGTVVAAVSLPLDDKVAAAIRGLEVSPPGARRRPAASNVKFFAS